MVIFILSQHLPKLRGRVPAPEFEEQAGMMTLTVRFSLVHRIFLPHTSSLVPFIATDEQATSLDASPMLEIGPRSGACLSLVSSESHLYNLCFCHRYSPRRMLPFSAYISRTRVSLPFSILRSHPGSRIPHPSIYTHYTSHPESLLSRFVSSFSSRCETTHP